MGDDLPLAAREQFMVFPPFPNLRGIVESVVVMPVSPHPPGSERRLLPTTYCQLGVRYGDGHDAAAGMQVNGLFLRARPLRTASQMAPRAGACAVLRFTPWGAADAWGGRMDPFFSRQVPLTELDDPLHVEALWHRLRAERDRPERINALLQTYVEKRLPTDQPRDEGLAGAAVRAILRDGGLRPMRELALLLDVGTRKLERHFLARIGCTPKQFARIVRFQRAVRQLLLGAPPAVVASENGFSDQAHFGREVLAMSGLTPTALVRRGQIHDALKHGNRLHLSGFFNTPHL